MTLKCSREIIGNSQLSDEIQIRLYKSKQSRHGYSLLVFISKDYAEKACGIKYGDRVNVLWCMESKKGALERSEKGAYKVVDAPGNFSPGLYAVRITWAPGMPFTVTTKGCKNPIPFNGYVQFDLPESACHIQQPEETEKMNTLAFPYENDQLLDADAANSAVGVENGFVSSEDLKDETNFFSSNKMLNKSGQKKRPSRIVSSAPVSFGTTFQRRKDDQGKRYYIYLLVSKETCAKANINPGDRVDILWNKKSNKGMVKKLKDNKGGWKVSVKQSVEERDTDKCTVKIGYIPGFPTISKTSPCKNIKPGDGSLVFDLPDSVSFEKNLREED